MWIRPPDVVAAIRWRPIPVHGRAEGIITGARPAGNALRGRSASEDGGSAGHHGIGAPTPVAPHGNASGRVSHGQGDPPLRDLVGAALTALGGRRS
jgi:hypothetical protein